MIVCGICGKGWKVLKEDRVIYGCPFCKGKEYEKCGIPINAKLKVSPYSAFLFPKKGGKDEQ